jgi:hypothetical protein
MNWAVETATTQTKPAYAGFKNLDFSSVRAGGLGLSSCDFQSPRLKFDTNEGLAPLPFVASVHKSSINEAIAR